MGFHLISKNVLLPVEPWGDENVIGIRSFKNLKLFSIRIKELFEPIVLQKKAMGFCSF